MELGEGHRFADIDAAREMLGLEFVRMIQPGGGDEIGQRLHHRGVGPEWSWWSVGRLASPTRAPVIANSA